jgi:hypothetical protein
MRNNPKRLYQSIQNTLTLLTDNKLTIFHNQPVLEEASGKVIITWPNHISGRHNCEPYFGKIAQYREIVRASAYTCLLLDGAIIRACYCFNHEELTSYSLLWWPSPFRIVSEDLDLGGVLDIIDLYASSIDWHEQIQMRTPVRFDFDILNASSDHPASHLHFQSSNCRLYVDRPMCFNRFIRFVFKYFYPEIYSKYSFWEDLDDMPLSVRNVQSLNTKQAYIGWKDHQHK